MDKPIDGKVQAEIMDLMLIRMKAEMELERAKAKHIDPLKDQVKAADRQIKSLLAEAAGGQGRLDGV